MANSTTGLTPFYVIFGKHPRMPDDILFPVLDDEDDNLLATQHDYTIEIAANLRKAYQFVIQQQELSSAANLKRLEHESQEIVYLPGQMVIVWQPQQPGYTCKDDTFEVLPESPSKWAPKWTGPHTIRQRKGVNTYDVIHNNGTIMERCNVNGLYPYTPWSEELTSTSTELDKVAPWSFRGITPSDSRVAVGFKGAPLYGIGKVITTPKSMEEPLLLQWISNADDDYLGVLRPGWKIHSDKKPLKRSRGGKATYPSTDVYYEDEPRNVRDEPYTTQDTDTIVTCNNYLVNGFRLTHAAKLPKSVIWAMAESRKLQFEE
jgi:hypothetical protein